MSADLSEEGGKSDPSVFSWGVEAQGDEDGKGGRGEKEAPCPDSQSGEAPGWAALVLSPASPRVAGIAGGAPSRLRVGLHTRAGR